MTTSHDNNTVDADDEERRRLALAQLSHLDDLTPDDEEEISRFRSYAAAPAGGSRHGNRFGRIFGHRPPASGRVAS